MVKYYREIIDNLFSSQQKVIAIRHYNGNKVDDETLEKLRKQINTSRILYKNFGENRIANPYDPFLEWIKEICAFNAIQIEELLEQCKVYSLHREVFISYLNEGKAKRTEKPLIDEVEFEEELFTQEIIRLIQCLAEHTPLCIIMDNINVAGYSTLNALKKLMENISQTMTLICFYNENDIEIESTGELWKSIVEYWEENDILLDVLGDENEEIRNNGFRCSSALIDDDYKKLMNLYHFMCLSEVEHYLSIYYHKFEVEKLAINPKTKFLFLELFAKVSMYSNKSAEALLYLNGMHVLLNNLEDEEWQFKYHIMATEIYMHSFQKELATYHINECKRLSDRLKDDKLKFEIALLEHMVLFKGWRDLWILDKNLPCIDDLVAKCIQYGYENHLAHIYVYAFENESERYANLAGLNIKMPNFLKGIKLAQKIGNYHFLIEAYKKNVIMASTNGYYSTANYFNEKIKEICLKYNELEELANNYNGMGYNCCVMEEYQLANNHYNNALSMIMQTDNMDKVNETVYNMGINCLLAMDYKNAEDLFVLCLKCISLIHANSVNVCNISKIYGLRAFCSYMLGQYYNTMINMQYVEQFLGHIIELENQDVDAPHLWDDDLAIFYTLSGLMNEKDGLYEKAYQNLVCGRKYMDRAVGSRFMFLCPYTIIFSRIAKKTGHDDEAEELIKEAKKYCRESNYKKRGKMLECMTEGQAYEPEELELGITKVDISDIIEKAKYTGMSKGYTEQREDLEFLGICQKILSDSNQDIDIVLDHAFVTLVNKYNLDDFIFVRMEQERPVLKYKICDKELTYETLWYIVDFFNERRGTFITSRLDKGYRKYQKFINRCFGFNSINTFIAVPIFTNERLDSVFLASVQMNMDWSYKSKKYLFDSNDLSVFTMFYHSIIDYIERMDAQKLIKKANKRLQKMAVNDQLTGIYNRQGMYDIFRKSLDSIAIIYADLDNFKYYNDTFGHDVGDKVLVEFAKMLGQVTSQRADAVRYGGDEFLLIMYTDDKEQVDEAVCNIYKKLEESEGLTIDISKSVGYELDIPKEKQLSCSIGIAMGHIDDTLDKKQQIESILKKADTMMYRVKHSTKNSYLYYEY